MITSQTRGHEIFFDGKVWRYSDNNVPVELENRPCIRCGRLPTKEGHDPCKSYIEGKVSVCCGHGVTEGIIL